MLQPGTERTPLHADAVAVADYYLDSHATQHLPTPPYEEGHLNIRATRPGQVRWGSLVPRGVSGLLVPVAVSSTHAGFSVIRMEPVWMALGAAAATAAHLAQATGASPEAVPVEALQAELARHDQRLAFFYDVPAGVPQPRPPVLRHQGLLRLLLRPPRRARQPLRGRRLAGSCPRSGSRPARRPRSRERGPQRRHSYGNGNGTGRVAGLRRRAAGPSLLRPAPAAAPPGHRGRLARVGRLRRHRLAAAPRRPPVGQRRGGPPGGQTAAPGPAHSRTWRRNRCGERRPPLSPPGAGKTAWAAGPTCRPCASSCATTSSRRSRDATEALPAPAGRAG